MVTGYRGKPYGVRFRPTGLPEEFPTIEGAARRAARASAGKRVPTVEVVHRAAPGLSWRVVPEAEWRGVLAARDGVL